MKKVINLKEIVIIAIILTIVTISASVLAADPGGLIVTDQGTTAATVDPHDYKLVQAGNEPTTGNQVQNNVVNNLVNNNVNNNNAKKYNTNNTAGLPQTGIEDYNIGILLIICVVSALYAYNKIKQYKNI